MPISAREKHNSPVWFILICYLTFSKQLHANMHAKMFGGDWLPDPNPLLAFPPFSRQSTVKGIRINSFPTGYITHLMYGVLAGMWYLHPGSKSFSVLSTAGSILWCLVLSCHHAVLQLSSVILPLKTFHLHWLIKNLKGRKAILRRAIFIKAFMSDSTKRSSKK